jgi:hypothetical protein
MPPVAAKARRGSRNQAAGKGRAAARPPAPAAATPADPWLAVGALFVGALAVRLLFWQAAPGTDWPHSPFFKGDAVVWLEHALSLERGRPFQLDLPLRPPGAAYLITLLWDGRRESLDWLRVAWLAMGALIPPVMFVALVRPLGAMVAWLASAGAAASTGLILLSSSLNNETPYLLLVAVTLALFEPLRRRPSVPRLAVWSLLHGVGCLLRVEHVLFYAGSLALLALAWPRQAAGAGASRWVASLTAAALSLAFFAGPLLPWQMHAWRSVHRFNTVVPEAAAEPQSRRMEERLSRVPWDDEARARRERLPAFSRSTSSAFVAATVVHRGGRRVRGQDFAVLEEAFGSVPRPMARLPFVAGYGPLNFALANSDGSSGGFHRGRLEEAPPLLGGAERYPAEMVRGLPPPDLALAYPPHLELYNDGYAIGLRWIRAHPAAFASLAARKLSRFWSGASLGATGYGLPLGLSGLRRSVDLVVPAGGAGVAAWRLAVLAVALAGLAAGWRRPALHPWLLLLLTKLAVTVAFFGYARQGAMAVPVVLVLAALAAERWLLRGPLLPLARRPAVAGLVLLSAAVAVEALRWQDRPEVHIDGALVTPAADPVPLDVHRDHRIDVR